MKIFILILSICIKSALVNASTNQEEHILEGFFAKRVGGLTEALSRIDQEKVPFNKKTLVLVDEDLFQEDRLSKFKIFSEKNCKLMFVKKNFRRFFSCDNEKYLSQNNISLFDPLNTEAFYFDGYYGAKIQNGYLHLPKDTPNNPFDLLLLDLVLEDHQLEDHQWLFFGKILKAMLACFKDKGIKLETLLYLSRKAEMFRSLYLESFSLKVVPIFINDRYFLASRDPIVSLEPLKDHPLIPEHTFNKWKILIQKFIQDPVEFCKMIQARLENEYFSLEDIFYNNIYHIDNKGFRKKWLKTLRKYYQTTAELSPLHLVIKYGYFKDVRDIFKFIREFKEQAQEKIFQNIPKEVQNVTKFLNHEENYLSLLSLVASIEDKNKKIIFLEQFGELLTILDQKMKPEKKVNGYWPTHHRLDVIRIVTDYEISDEEKKKNAINRNFKPLIKAFYGLNENQWEPIISFFKKKFLDEGIDIFYHSTWPSKEPEDIVKTAHIYFHLIPFYPQILKGDSIVDPELSLNIIEVIQNFLRIKHISDYSICLKTFFPDPSFIKKFFLATKSKFNILKKINTNKGVEFYKKISDEKFKHIMLYLDKNEWFGFTGVFGWEMEGPEWQYKLTTPEEETASKYLSFLGNFDLSTDEKKSGLRAIEKKFIDLLSWRFDRGSWKKLSQVSYKEYIRQFVEKCSSPEISSYQFALDLWLMCPYIDSTGCPKLVDCLQNQDRKNIEKIIEILCFYVNQIPSPYTIFIEQGGTDRFIKLIKAMIGLSFEQVSHFYENMEKEYNKKLNFVLARNISTYDKASVLFLSGNFIYLNFEKAVLEAASDQSNEKKL